ncbi:MAG: fibronectin type III domain-containing protein [Bacteroidota bacterium]
MGKVHSQSIDEIKGEKVKDIKSLKDNVKDPAWVDVPVRDENGVIRPSGSKKIQPIAGNYEPFQLDAAVQKVEFGTVSTESKNKKPTTNAPVVGSNINGLPYQFLNPADPTIAVGPNHIIQMVNGTSGSLLQIWNKATGAVVVPSRYMDQITTKGGLGDPIVLYDQMANRFIMSEFVNSIEVGQEGLSIAVSATGDPTGAWYIYFFGTGTVFPDYPKFSVWHNAYYASTNDFNLNTYSGSTIYAFDRAKMLAGDPTASVQKFTFGTTIFSRYYAMSPVNQQGTASSTSGGLFAYIVEDAWTADVNDRDSIGLIEFNPNFSNPLLSSYATIQSMPVATTNTTICSALRGACIPMPGTVTRLEGLGNRVMNQPMYRNFGASEGIVLVTTVNDGTGVAAPRWYEVTRSNGGSWSIRQQSTYTTGGVHRWMSGISYTAAGDIALAYNVSDGISTYPGLRFTGRTQCDPLNTMTMPETVIVSGTSFNASSRYGDYNHLVTDPDGTRFWFTGMFNDLTRWNTKVSSFTIDNCATPPATCTAPSGLTVASLTSTSSTVSWTAGTNSIAYAVEYKAASSTTWLTATANTTALSWTISGLQPATNYNWRISATCSNTSYTSAESSFVTAIAPACGTPQSLRVTTIGATSVAVAWNAVSGAASYRIEYKLPGTATWTLAASANTTLTQSITGLIAFSLYDWRVAATCSGTLGTYASAQFRTGDSFESNETAGASRTITVNTNVLAAISTPADLDWFRFTIERRATQKNLRIVLNSMPAAYDVSLFNTTTATTALGTKIVSGTGPSRTVTITYNVNNTRDVTYYVRVSGSATEFNNVQTYTLNALTAATAFSALNPADPGNLPDPGIAVPPSDASPEITRLYPVPAKNQLMIEYLALGKGKCTIMVLDHLGNKKLTLSRNVDNGNNTIPINIIAIPGGQYILQIIQGNHLSTKRFEIRK